MNDCRQQTSSEGAEPKPRVKYARPPIQEAICEIHFELPAALDENAIARIKPVWQEDYPNQQLAREQSLELHLGLDRLDARSTPVGHKLITRSQDGKNLAQLGPRFLAVNRLKPYLGWEESFRDTITARLHDVRTLYSFERVERIGLRYINRIDVPAKPVRWSDWLAVKLPVPGNLGDMGGTFQFHLEQTLSDHLQAKVNWVCLPTPAEAVTSFILDIDVIWRGTVGADALGPVLESVHAPHRDLFEGYLLDKTRRLFHIDP